MVKVITYGTYDMLHYGHIRLLERAKRLGDYLIIGVTSDNFDRARGKINVQQSLTERVEAIRETGLADLIIVEEYEGQKIDDIVRYDVDIFAIGSDWIGKFDYLNEYCRVEYLERTKGVSSSELRAKERKVKIGFVGSDESRILKKYCTECRFVNGLEIAGICTDNPEVMDLHGNIDIYKDYQALLEACDAVYILSHPTEHYEQIRRAIEMQCHVLVELPIGIEEDQCRELISMAKEHGVILMPAMKTAYAIAYNRLLLLVKSGRIGDVVSVDSTCTSLIDSLSDFVDGKLWDSMSAWGPTALLPVFHLLGTDYVESKICSVLVKEGFDAFSKVDFVYRNAVASIKVGRGAKSEGDLIITGTKGYVYVPAPWWKTEYFELRFEDPANNRRYFYQLDGEGIRYELVAFVKAINKGKLPNYISDEIASNITKIIQMFYSGIFTEIVVENSIDR